MTAEKGNRVLSSVHILILWLHFNYCAPYSVNFYSRDNVSTMNLQLLF